MIGMLTDEQYEKYIITEKELDDVFTRISRNVNYYRLNNNSELSDKYGRMTIDKLAELCNVSRSLIANITSIKTRQTFSITVIATIAKVLDVPFEEFFIEHDFSKPARVTNKENK